MVPFVTAHAGRAGLTEQLSVHLDGRDCLGAAECGLVVVDHRPAIGEQEAHGRHGRIAAGLSPHGYPGHLFGLDRVRGHQQLFESLGNRKVLGCQRLAVDEQGHCL